ncbi:MAG TPA: T9SS type A sorting domain-containing protein [Bacteroidota bacterium]|nr:T9SS type A sorting domain-containing protein [Bacteroidota bacterium]
MINRHVRATIYIELAARWRKLAAVRYAAERIQREILMRLCRLLLLGNVIISHGISQPIIPIANGDTWYYKHTLSDYSYPNDTTVNENLKYVATSDTMINSNLYHNMVITNLGNNSIIGYDYWHSDTLQFYFLGLGTTSFWRPFGYDNRVSSDTVWGGITIGTGAGDGGYIKLITVDLFGVNTAAQEMFSHTRMTQNEWDALYITTQGFGPTMMKHFYFSDASNYAKIDAYEITGAILRGVQYGNVTSVRKGIMEISQYYLSQNYPNPFNPSTQITFSVPITCYVSLKIFDLLGQYVATVTEGEYSPGVYSVYWNGSNHASGVYFYRLQSNTYSETKKFLLQK